MITSKELITVGYPRSGNTFLNYAFKSMYYFDEVNCNLHTGLSIKKYNRVFVPLRNPLDCISSWHDYSNSDSLQSDIKYYLRFHYVVLENPSVIRMDFDKFTKNLTYIQKQIFDNFKATIKTSVTMEQIKATMRAEQKEINLPRNNKKTLDAIKTKLQNMPEFEECLNLYDKLKP